MLAPWHCGTATAITHARVSVSHVAARRAFEWPPTNQHACGAAEHNTQRHTTQTNEDNAPPHDSRIVALRPVWLRHRCKSRVRSRRCAAPRAGVRSPNVMHCVVRLVPTQRGDRIAYVRSNGAPQSHGKRRSHALAPQHLPACQATTAILIKSATTSVNRTPHSRQRALQPAELSCAQARLTAFIPRFRRC